MRCGGIDHQLFSLGFLLILVGFFTVFAGAILLALKGGGTAEGGGVVFIGPIPIAFGTSKKAAFIALIIGLIVFLLFLALAS